jgi:hypothetical protein
MTRVQYRVARSQALASSCRPLPRTRGIRKRKRDRLLYSRIDGDRKTGHQGRDVQEPVPAPAKPIALNWLRCPSFRPGELIQPIISAGAPNTSYSVSPSIFQAVSDRTLAISVRSLANSVRSFATPFVDPRYTNFDIEALIKTRHSVAGGAELGTLEFRAEFFMSSTS